MDTRPAYCRFRLMDEGKAYPRSSCTACGKTITTGLGNSCPNLQSEIEALRRENERLREANPSEKPNVEGVKFPLAFWQEQAAFEEWAIKSRYEMHKHPLHYMFMDKQTDAARQGWKAALAFALKLQDAALATRKEKGAEG